jgi:hypothetical protein
MNACLPFFLSLSRLGLPESSLETGKRHAAPMEQFSHPHTHFSSLPPSVALFLSFPLSLALPMDLVPEKKEKRIFVIAV